MDSAERDWITPGVVLNWKLETCQVTDAGIAMALARIWNRGVMPPPMTVIRGRVSTRTPPSAEESGTRLRLEDPRKSSAYTATRNSERSNRSMSYVDALISSPPGEAAAWTEAPDCRRLQFISESTGKEYNRAPATVRFPPNTSITASAPIPPNAKPVDGCPTASFKKSTPSYPLKASSITLFT